MNFQMTCEMWKFLAGIGCGWIIGDIIKEIYRIVKGR